MTVRFRDRSRVNPFWWGSLALLAACGATGPGPGPGPAEDSAPSVAAVRDGIDADMDQQELRSSLFANWDSFADPDGFPVVYEWCIGRSPGGSDVMVWTYCGGATRVSTVNVDLPAGFPLYVSVRATDIAGNRSAVATSDGIVIGQIDRQPRPEPATPAVVAPIPVAVPAPVPEPVSEPSTNREPDPGSTTPPATTAAPTPVVDEPAPPPSVPEPVRDGVTRSAAIERFGITWTFARPVECGQFVNGDWWVAGPCEIVAIHPQSRTDDGRTRHGSMVNPDPREHRQGYDSAMFGADSAGRFDPALNKALGISRDKRLRLEPGQSLVSTVSHAQPGQMPQLETCAVLTCLPSVPPPDAFRPPYSGRDKQCKWRLRDLDLSRLARLEAPPNAPLPSELLPRFERTWLDHIGGWTGRFLHPRENMPDYGRDIGDLVGTAGLVLQLDYPDTEKRPLALAMVQLGIDLHGIVASGGRFLADGGSGSGRKFPVLLAGTLLQDRELLATARQRKLAFAEDAQTFFVEQTSPGIWNGGHGDYGPDDTGLAEWGNQHADDPSLDRKSWTSDPFRRCCTANVWHGFVLATRIMGLRDAWGHPALFEYVDRYMQVEASGTWTRSWSPFPERMWDRYRAQF
jgi:hypothetical protein